jgi:hypothetical protein
MNYKNIAFLFAIICCSSQIIFSSHDGSNGISGKPKESNLAAKKLELYNGQLANLDDQERKLRLNEGYMSSSRACLWGSAISATAGTGCLVVKDAPKYSALALFILSGAFGFMSYISYSKQRHDLNQITEEKKQVLNNIDNLKD